MEEGQVLIVHSFSDIVRHNSLCVMKLRVMIKRYHYAFSISSSTSQSSQVGLSYPLGLELRKKPFQ